MSDSLHSEVLVPTHSHLPRMLVAALGTGAVGIGLALALAPRPAAVSATAVEPDPEIIPVTIESIEHTEPPRSPALGLVFSADGASYMKLADLGGTGDALPAHGAPRLITENYVETAIASVNAADVPAAYRSWADREVVVDNTCRTKVTGFAIVSRLTGDTGYAGTEDKSWTANNVLELGSTVLAAKLADCTGTFARDAALPAVVVPEELQNAALVEQARAAVIASTPAQDAQREWLEYEQGGNWYDAADTVFATHVLHHPTTGVTWVSVHAYIQQGCGAPEANVWGLFRVQPDGTLAAVQLRKLGDLWKIDQLIDIDNDGELELIGKPWLGLDTVVTRASGEELERLPLAFFGCAC